MSTRSMLFVSLFAFALPACGGSISGNGDGTGALDGKADRGGNAHYYTLRQDGGTFVKRVNQTSTACADGVSRSECQVAGVDFSATKLSDDERAAFAGKPVIVRGQLVSQAVQGGSAATLVVDEVWVGAVGQSSAGEYAAIDGTAYKVVDTGVRCIAAPCLTYRETKLNQTHSTDVAGVELAAVGADDAAVGEAYNALTAGGLLVAGHNEAVSGPAGKAQQLVATNFYRRVQHVATGTITGDEACGGFAGLGCGAGEYCDVTTANACGGADLMGVCKPLGELCNQVYVPVCGCDGKTYANDCERVQAQVQLAHDGACN